MHLWYMHENMWHTQCTRRRQRRTLDLFIYLPPLYHLHTGSLSELEAFHFTSVDRPAVELSTCQFHVEFYLYSLKGRGLISASCRPSVLQEWCPNLGYRCVHIQTFTWAEIWTQVLLLAEQVLYLCRPQFYFCFWYRVSKSLGWPQIPYVAEGDLELLMLLPASPECWDYRWPHISADKDDDAVGFRQHFEDFWCRMTSREIKPASFLCPRPAAAGKCWLR